MTMDNVYSFKKNLEKYKYFASWMLWYPDLFLDLNTPSEGGIKLCFDQRIMLRCITRFFSTYGCFPRGSGKTWSEVIASFLLCVRYPNLNISITAQTRENAASILKDKYNEIVRQYPFFENEIVKTTFQKEISIIIFRNGSKIDNLANQQSSKGQRRHRINVEESALMDAVTFEDALKPIVEVGRLTAGKLSITNPEELNQQINFFTTPSFRGSDEFQRSLEMVKAMINLEGDIVLGSNWMLPCWYGRGSSRSIILKKKKEMSPVSFAMNYGGEWTGTSSGALVSMNRLMNCRTLTAPVLKSENDDDEFYIGVDVARSERKTNNQSSIAVIQAIRNKSNKIVSLNLVNIIHVSNTLNFETQACIVKSVKKRYNARMVIVDGNGLGSGLIDALMKDTYDPKTNETYIAWNTVNTTAEPDNPNAEPVLFDLKAQTDQTKIISTFINMVDGEKLRFLEPRKGGDFEVADDEIDSKVMPYVQAELFFQEVGNLKLKQSGGRLAIDKVVRRLDKDRFSAVAYCLYYIENFEGVYNKPVDFKPNNFVSFLKKVSKKPKMY